MKNDSKEIYDLKELNSILLSALERLNNDTKLLIKNRSVRNLDETFAEVENAIIFYNNQSNKTYVNKGTVNCTGQCDGDGPVHNDGENTLTCHDCFPK